MSPRTLSDARLSPRQDLEVKSLLLEAYVKGQQELLYVVPFVAKVLESSLRSMVSAKLIRLAVSLLLLKDCLMSLTDLNQHCRGSKRF